MYYTMKAHKPASPRDLVPEKHTEMISFRLRPSDNKALIALADEAKVGHTTLARLIVEKYIADHAHTEGK
jgi:hypothetical protein